MFTEAHGTDKMYTKLVVSPAFPPSKNLPNLVEEKKSYLLVSSSDQHYHCEIEAERGPTTRDAGERLMRH